MSGRSPDQAPGDARPIRAAFVTHDVGLFGSARSLSLALRTCLAAGRLTPDRVTLFYLGRRFRRIVPSPLFPPGIHYRPTFLPYSFAHFKGRADRAIEKLRYLAIGCGLNLLFALAWLFSIRPWLRQFAPTVVHVNSHVLWPVLLALDRRRYRVVVHIRDLLDPESYPRLSRLIVDVIRRRADAVIAIDELAAKPYRDHPQLHVLRNPYDMSLARQLRQSDAGVLRRRYAVPDGKRVVALIGKVVELKGAHRFLDLARRSVADPTLHFLVVGDGSGSYYRTQVEGFAALPNCTLTGLVEAIDEIYAICDVVVRCDAFLPLGRTLWEAYFAGCRCVIPWRGSEDTGEIAALIDRGVWLYRADDGDDFAAALARCLAAEHCLDAIPTGTAAEYAESFVKILAGPVAAPA